MTTLSAIPKPGARNVTVLHALEEFYARLGNDDDTADVVGFAAYWLPRSPKPLRHELADLWAEGAKLDRKAARARIWSLIQGEKARS